MHESAPDELVVSEGQGWQEALLAALKDPGGHGLHSLAPTGRQGRHCGVKAAIVQSAEHCWQPGSIPSKLLLLPAGQDLHVVDLGVSE